MKRTPYLCRDDSRSPRWCMLLAACWLIGAVAAADPLHAIGNGAFQHHDSSWVFPSEIAGFVRVGVPQDIDGTSDAVAYYARVVNSSRITVSVEVHSPDSAPAGATLSGTKTAVELEIHAGNATGAWLQRPFMVGRQGAVEGIKAIYATGAGADATQINLYFIDTGSWVVRIKARVPGTQPDSLDLLDDFVREQQWESLAPAR